MAPAIRKRDAQGRFTANGHQRRAVISAATRYELGDPIDYRATRASAEWQRRAWQYFDLLGEVKYGATFLGNAISKLRIFAARKPDDPEQDPEQATDEHANAAVKRLTGDRRGEAASLLAEIAINFVIAGECYLIGRNAAGATAEEPESWEIRSILEVEQAGRSFTVKGSDGGKRVPLDAQNDLISRLFLRHAGWSDQADSPLRGVLATCEQLLFLEAEQRATARNRIPVAGLLFVPQDLSHGPADPTAEGLDPSDQNPFMSRLTEALLTPIQDEGSASAVVPMLVEGPADLGEKIRYIKFERPRDQYLDRDLERAIRRLAQGLNLPVEIILGIADINHWGAWQIEESTFKAHVEPFAMQILDSLTVGYFWPALEAANVADPQQYLLWYDATRLVARPNPEARAAEALDRDAISWEAYRRALGFGDEDKPTDEELVRRAGLRGGGIDAFLKEALLRMLTPDLLVERLVGPGTSPVTTGPSSNGDGAPPAAAPVPQTAPSSAPPGVAAAVAGRPLGRALADIDRTLRDRLLVAASAAVQRALEREGARLRGRAQKSTKADVRDAITSASNADVARILGPTVVAALGLDDEEIEELLDPLLTKFRAWTAAAQSQALALVPGIDEALAASTAARQADSLDEAVDWLQARLVALVRERLFSVEIDIGIGEYDETLVVPAGLIREAVARAGGQSNLASLGAWVSLGAEGRIPLGGIGTGEILQTLLKEQGWGTTAYEWEYGAFPRSRPFEPHQNLDGVIFSNFDDPVLANLSGFPSVPFYMPGDHAGCVCDAVPVLVAPSLFPSPVVD